MTNWFCISILHRTPIKGPIWQVVRWRSGGLDSIFVGWKSRKVDTHPPGYMPNQHLQVFTFEFLTFHCSGGMMNIFSFQKKRENVTFSELVLSWRLSTLQCSHPKIIRKLIQSEKASREAGNLKPLPRDEKEVQENLKETSDRDRWEKTFTLKSTSRWW